uniref:Uncharacterized protein n=1 Tax=Streptomyces avermitilis TaxID=33903 RepID=A0A499VGD2_STRAX|nr:hypothetical protein SAVMC3_60230 [Streptomyces avermitilis]
MLPVYLEEISSTLSGTCFKLTKPQIPVAELAEAGFQAIETGMTEGHPCFVANNGRLGFGSTSTSRTPPRPRARCGWCGWPRTARGPRSRRAWGSSTSRSCARNWASRH